jgi:hypothetical protein
MSGFDFDSAVEVIKAKGGLASTQHPLLFGRLHKAAGDLDVPVDIVEGVDLELDPSVADIVSDSDSDSEYEPGESSDDDALSEISFVSEGELAEQQGADADFNLDSDAE